MYCTLQVGFCWSATTTARLSICMHAWCQLVQCSGKVCCSKCCPETCPPSFSMLCHHPSHGYQDLVYLSSKDTSKLKDYNKRHIRTIREYPQELSPVLSKSTVKTCTSKGYHKQTFVGSSLRALISLYSIHCIFHCKKLCRVSIWTAAPTMFPIIPVYTC